MFSLDFWLWIFGPLVILLTLSRIIKRKPPSKKKAKGKLLYTRRAPLEETPEYGKQARWSIDLGEDKNDESSRGAKPPSDRSS